MNINDTSVKFFPSLRNLGVTLGSTLSLHQHVLSACRGAFLEVRRINSIRNFLTTDAVETLVYSLVLSHIDYCNYNTYQDLIQVYTHFRCLRSLSDTRTPTVKAKFYG